MTQDTQEAHSYWCPFGRISLQEVSNARTDILSGGAFNLSVVTNAGTSNEVTYPSARCLGEICPFFVPSKRRSKHDSICRMAKDPSKRVVVSACLISLAVILAGIAIAGAIVWTNALTGGGIA